MARLLNILLLGLPIVLLILNCTPSYCFGANTIVSIDASQEYQNIDGFGGTEHWLFPPPSEYAIIFDDLGVSILRFRMLRYTEATPDKPGNEARENDNDNPNVINWDGVDLSSLAIMAPLLKSAQIRGVKLFGNILCPPPWMKTSNIAEGRGSLRTEYEDELVEFILIWVKGMEKYHGVHIDYVNFENEPNYQRSYPSCYMSPFQIRSLTKKLGERFKAEGITTKIVPPETSNLWTFKSWTDKICQDPVVNSYIECLSTHSYNISFWKPDKNIKHWVDAYRTAFKYGKRLWLTEYCLDYSNQKGTWNEAITLVQHVHNALVHGQVSAWLYHELYRDPSGSPLALIDKNIDPYPKFYTLKQYFRYVRPGAVRIKAECSSDDILVTSFVHKGNATFTSVAINRQTTDQPVVFRLNNIEPLSPIKVVRSSTIEHSADLGHITVIGNSFTYTLPGKSITTFSGTFDGSIRSF